MNDIFKGKRIEKIDGDKLFLFSSYQEFLKEVQSNASRCLNHMGDMMKMINYEDSPYIKDAMEIGQLANNAAKKELERIQEEFREKTSEGK